jgi:hypothetical protein
MFYSESFRYTQAKACDYKNEYIIMWRVLKNDSREIVVPMCGDA